MELNFEQTQIAYLQTVLHETILQEESGEVIVPDSMPDVERIVDHFAAVTLRGKECRDGALSLSGDIQAGVLYVAQQEDMPRQIPLYLPFAVRRSVAGEDCRCMVQCRVRSVDTRMLNSRKLSIRVGLCITLWVWQPREEACCRPVQTERRVQMRASVYPMKLPVECTEKNLLLRDTLSPGAGQPEVMRLLHVDARCEVTDEKLNGDKAVCKGNVHLHVLYETPEQTVAACELTMPFSQFVGLAHEYEEQGLRLMPVLTSLEAAAEDDGITAEVGICMQCCVMQTIQVPMIEDAYATRGVLTTQWQTYGMQPQLDQRRLREELRLELPAQASEILHAEALPDAVQVAWSAGNCRLCVPVQVQVLYRDAQGQLQTASRRSELTTELPAEDLHCEALAWPDGTLFTAAGAGGIEVRLPMAIDCAWYGDTALRSICGAALEDENAPDERPAVIIRTLEQDCALWDIAKELRTTVSAICIANDMEADTAPAGTMLLIPIVA